MSKRQEEIIKKEMTYREALSINKRKGWYYSFFQLGYSQYKTKNNF